MNLYDEKGIAFYQLTGASAAPSNLSLSLSLSLNCLFLLVMLAAGDLTKQLSESFTPDYAVMFGSQSI